MHRYVMTLLFSFAAWGATPVAPGVHLIPGVFVPGTQPDGNTVVFSAREGLIVVDTGRHAAHTQSIIDFAKEAGQPVKAVINTHWHLDHIGGNILLRREYPGVKVYASSALNDARKSFLASYRKQLEEMIARTPDAEGQKPFREEMAIIDAGDQLGPDVIISRSSKQSIAGLKLNVALESLAVTAGDVWIYDSKTKVLVAGDLVTLPAPFLDTACPSGWKASLDRVAKTDFEVLVPGHGAPMTRRDFLTYRAAFGNLLTCSASQKTKEECINGWMTDASPLLPEKDHKFTRSLMDYYVDVLRGDPAKIAARCAS